jgi:nitrogen fixation/metabolism regulation signal transduction histidine kinase
LRALRNRLIAAFVVATILPLTATVWIATSLIERSLGYATTRDIDRLSRTLEDTARQFYHREREALRQEALAGRVAPAVYAVADSQTWPDHVRSFWDSGDLERFGLSGPGADHVDYMRRGRDLVEVFSRDLGGMRMQELSAEFRQAREVVDTIAARDLRRGFTLTLLLLVGLVWAVSLVPLVVIAKRISTPIQRLTAGLTDFAAGNWDRRLEAGRDDEVGRAVAAFNHMAEQLHQSRDRLIYLTQMSSWQSLARKTAHELKNSLTPIRLTVEEMLARHAPADRAFMETAAQIVISEIDTLERRVRAFSEFSSEPSVEPDVLCINTLVAERIALLRPVHPDATFHVRLDNRAPRVRAGADLVKGVLTNLLANAAEAAAPGGSILTITRLESPRVVVVEVHDSGPGIARDAASALFEPTITFKKNGMGLGLSIARKNALLAGGDIVLVDGELGGAAFRVVLPALA